MSSDARRGLRVAVAITAAGALLIAALRAWLPPPEHLAGLVLLPIWGLALGVFAWRTRPGWQARAVGLGGLVLAGIAINAFWLPGMQAAARDAPLGLRAHSDLLSRTLTSWHPLISTRSLHLALRRLVEGREVRWVRSEKISPRRLLVLARADRLVEIDEPGSWVPGPDEWSERYETIFLELRTRQPGGLVHDRVVGVTDGAEQAEWFVVLEREGTTLAIPDRVWESERRRARRTQP
jgi:hypothetical protein